MITLHDLDTAIARCQGQETPTAETCKQLAAFYTIKQYMFGEQQKEPRIEQPSYSYAPPPKEQIAERVEKITTDGDSDFLLAVNGKDTKGVLTVIDELMGVVRALNPRLYNGVLRNIEKL